MKYSNKLDLDRFFFAVRDQAYVIIKMADFPNYYKGSDIDVFCYDLPEYSKLILSAGNWYLDKGFEIKVGNKGEKHTYIDFYYEGELEFRFDLYHALPEYKKIDLRPQYIFSVIENALFVERKSEDKEYMIYIPSRVDELLLRYIEYIEWYETRPDKVKHIDYILKEANALDERISFFDKLHLYTKLPDPSYKEPSIRYNPSVREFVQVLKKIRSVPLYRLPVIAFYKVFKKGG